MPLFLFGALSNRCLLLVILVLDSCGTTIRCVSGLDNGLGLTPPMGFNAWYALHHHLTTNYTWQDGYVLSHDFYDIAVYMQQKHQDDNDSFYEAGYRYMNLDDAIVQGSRHAVTQRL